MPEELTPDPSKGGRTFVPTRTYDLQVTIDDLDYSQDLILARFTSSLTTGYQAVDMIFELDPNDIILQQVYGSSQIKLAITLLRENEQQGPRIDLDLLFTAGDFSLNEKEKISTKDSSQKDRGYYAIRTVLREPYKIMNTLVNKIFTGTTLSSIISTLGSSVGAGSVQYDTDGQNKKSIDQVCIPPTTFYKIIKEYSPSADNPFDGFLDQRFGLFDGVPGVFCQYDKKVYVKNLTSKMQKNPAFTIYQIATDLTQEEWDKILNEVDDGNTFYTFQTVSTDYAGNAKFAKVGSTIKHIVKPKDTLSYTISQDLRTVSGNYGVIYKNKNLDVDKAAERTRYMIQDTGDEKNETIFNSRTSRRVADMSTLTIALEKNLPLVNLINVGECVKFKPKTTEYADLEGKYILWSTDVWFRRANNWQTTAEVKLMRTNKRGGDIVKPKRDLSVQPENRAQERAKEKTAKALGISKEDVESLNPEPTPQQVTQTTTNFRHPDSYTPEEAQEIRENMQIIKSLKNFNDACELQPERRGCSAREIKERNRQIEQLRQRNLYLTTVR